LYSAWMRYALLIDLTMICRFELPIVAAWEGGAAFQELLCLAKMIDRKEQSVIGARWPRRMSELVHPNGWALDWHGYAFCNRLTFLFLAPGVVCGLKIVSSMPHLVQHQHNHDLEQKMGGTDNLPAVHAPSRQKTMRLEQEDDSGFACCLHSDRMYGFA
jgi:hypothetical protein